MPVIAESPRVGHGFPSTLIAGPAHDQAALNILPQEGLLAGPVMSFNVLLQSENFEMIKRDVRDLSSLTGRFPEYTSMLASPVQEGDLASLLRLSGNIITSLDKIAHLRRDRNDANDAADTGEKRTHSDAGDYKTKRRRLSDPSCCHDCGRIQTPRWRAGPDGRRTLCNVCGLLHAKREKRHAKHNTARRHKDWPDMKSRR